MHTHTNLLINASNKAAKFIQRDFHELQLLQGSKSNTTSFSSHTYQRIKTILIDELQKTNIPIIFSDEQINFNLIRKDFIFAIPIDSLRNFSRALAYFAVVLVYFKYSDKGLIATNVIINFPATNEVIYAEKGAGAWSSNSKHSGSRLRSSSIKNLEDSIISGDTKQISSIFNNNLRNFSSIYYDLLLFSAAKTDIIFYQEVDAFTKQIITCFSNEIGGFIMESSNFFVVTNQYLQEKIENLIS